MEGETQTNVATVSSGKHRKLTNGMLFQWLEYNPIDVQDPDGFMEQGGVCEGKVEFFEEAFIRWLKDYILNAQNLGVF